jgi:hypothetical protein
LRVEPALRRPQQYRHSLAVALLAGKQIAIVELRPRPFILEHVQAIPDRYRNMRDIAWKIIEPLTDSRNLPAILDKETRSTLISARAVQLGVEPHKIRGLLYRYWATEVPRWP